MRLKLFFWKTVSISKLKTKFQYSNKSQLYIIKDGVNFSWVIKN